MKRCIIVGAGEVGEHVAKQLLKEQWEVVIIDSDQNLCDRLMKVDVAIQVGHGSSPIVLQEAGIEQCQLLVAVTDSDETNIVACTVANSYAPKECRKIARVRNPDYMNNSCLFKEGLGIDYVINPEEAACYRVLDLLETPFAADIIRIADRQVQVLGLKLPDASPLYGKTLAEVGMLYPDRRLLAAAIERDGTIIIPRGDNVLQEGDKVFLVVKQEKVNSTLDYFGTPKRALNNVVIVGGGFLGTLLAEKLHLRGVTVRIIDQSRERCELLAEQLHSDIIVLNGDPTDQEFMDGLNLKQKDAFLTTTLDEATNILSGLISKRAETPQVIAMVNKLSYSPLAHHIGLDAVISPRLVAASQIIKFIRQGKILQLDTLGEQQAEVIEYETQPNTPILDTPLMDLQFPDNALIAAVVRDENVFIPTGTSVLEVGDRVVVFALRSAIVDVEKLLMPEG